MRCTRCLARRARRGRCRSAYAHLVGEATAGDYLRLALADWWLDWLYDREGIR
jgi:hypothetical protein